MPPIVRVNLNVEVDILTRSSAADMTNAILESLLYQRNQIPFVYKTYRHYVNKWLEDEKKQKDMVEECTGIQSFQVQRQKNQAKVTKNAISAMRKVICDAFERQSISCLRFLFGATPFTPKEAYTIHIPADVISVSHCNDHHRISPTKLNQTLLSLLTSEELYGIFSKNLNPTNVYLELKSLDLPSSSSSEHSGRPSFIFPKEFSPLPASCMDIQLHLVPMCNADFDNKQLKCCKELAVFEDIINLNIESVVKNTIGSTERDIKTSNEQDVWWESEIVVRGFKDRPIKGFNLWS